MTPHKVSEVVLKIRAETSQFKAQLRSLSSSMSASSSKLGTMGNTLNKPRVSLVNLASGFYLVRSSIYAVIHAFQVLTSPIRQAIHDVEDFKIASIQTAAIITTMFAPKGGKSFESLFKESLEYGNMINRTFVKINKNTATGIDHMRLINRELVKGGILLDPNNSAQIKGFESLSNAIFTLTAGMPSLVRQMSQETRAIIEGRGRAGIDTLATLVKDKLGDAWKSIIKEWISGGVFLERMSELLIGFGASSREIQHTWGSVTSTFKSYMSEIKRLAFTDIYEDFIKKFADFNQVIIDNQYEIAAVFRNVYQYIYYLIKDVVGIGMYLGQFVLPVIEFGLKNIRSILMLIVGMKFYEKVVYPILLWETGIKKVFKAHFSMYLLLGEYAKTAKRIGPNMKIASAYLAVMNRQLIAFFIKIAIPIGAAVAALALLVGWLMKLRSERKKARDEAIRRDEMSEVDLLEEQLSNTKKYYNLLLKEKQIYADKSALLDEDLTDKERYQLEERIKYNSFFMSKEARDRLARVENEINSRQYSSLGIYRGALNQAYAGLSLGTDNLLSEQQKTIIFLEKEIAKKQGETPGEPKKDLFSLLSADEQLLMRSEVGVNKLDDEAVEKWIEERNEKGQKLFAELDADWKKSFGFFKLMKRYKEEYNNFGLEFGLGMLYSLEQIAEGVKAVTSEFKTMFEVMQEIGKKVTESLKEGFSSFFESVMTPGSDMAEQFRLIWQGVLDTLRKQIADFLAEQIVILFLDFFMGGLGSFLKQVANFFAPEKHPGVGAGSVGYQPNYKPAYTGMKKYAGGSFNIPVDQVAQIHKGEMIIPASQADSIRSGNSVLGMGDISNKLDTLIAVSAQNKYAIIDEGGLTSVTRAINRKNFEMGRYALA